MKKKSIILIGAMAMILSSCLVKSLHQFYNEEDVIFEEKLIGEWYDSDSTYWKISPYIFSKGFMKGDSVDNSYLVEMFEEDSLHPSRFNVHLFKLKDKLFLDFMPIRDDSQQSMVDLHLVPTHSIAGVNFQPNDKVEISWYNESFLEDLFSENRIKISHEIIKSGQYSSEKEYVLTASTDELQKFLLKFGTRPSSKMCEDDDNFLCTTLARKK
jgi:hypothetical protein